MVKKVNKLMTIMTLVGAGVVGVNSAENVINVNAENIYDTNLAAPDLQGKEHLGDGIYRLYDENIIIDYNVFNGIWTIDGTNTLGISYNLFNIEHNTEYTFSYIAVSGTFSGHYLSFNSFSPSYDVVIIYEIDQNLNRQNAFITTTQNIIRLYIGPDRTFDNFQFKLQLEVGDTATPYNLPITPIDQHYSMLYDDVIENAYDTGYRHGEQDGYDLGFQDGRTKDYDDGYNDGYNDGNNEGYNVGYMHGEQDGYYLGYDDGYDDGYDKGRSDYGIYWGGDWRTAELYGNYQYDIGYDLGYVKGVSAEDATGFGGLGTAIFSGLGDLLSVEILPGIYIGAIIAVPLVFGIIFFILGKRKGD